MKQKIIDYFSTLFFISGLLILFCGGLYLLLSFLRWEWVEFNLIDPDDLFLMLRIVIAFLLVLPFFFNGGDDNYDDYHYY